MAIVEIVHEIAMTSYTIASQCIWRPVVGITPAVAHCAISLHHEVRIMAVQASVNGVRNTVTVCIRKRDIRARNNGLAIKHMVAVRKTRRVTHTAVSFDEIVKYAIIHTDVLVDRRGEDICPART
jgi:hypothetical protein